MPMQSRHGYTLVELTVAVAVIAVMSSATMLAVGKYLASMRTYSVAYQIADRLSVARSTAIARYETARVCLEPGGATLFDTFVVETCDPAAGTCDPSTHASWTPVEPSTQTSARVRIQTVSGSANSISFDRVGRFLGGATTLRVCNGIAQTDGSVACSGDWSYIIEISPVTGRAMIKKE